MKKYSLLGASDKPSVKGKCYYFALLALLFFCTTSMYAQNEDISFGDYKITFKKREGNSYGIFIPAPSRMIYNNYFDEFRTNLYCNKSNGVSKWGTVITVFSNTQRYTPIQSKGIAVKTKEGKNVEMLPYKIEETTLKNGGWRYDLYFNLDMNSLKMLCEDEIKSMTFNLFKEKLKWRDFEDVNFEKFLNFYYDARSIIENETWRGWTDRTIKVNNEPTPKSVKVKIERYDGYVHMRDERLREWGIKGYVDAMAKYCEISIQNSYNPETPAWHSEISNVEVEDIMPFLRAGKDRYADIQFYYACILSGDYSYDGITKERAANDTYNYLNLPKAKEYFQKYLNNPNRAKRQPFGWSDEAIKRSIKNVFPELVK